MMTLTFFKQEYLLLNNSLGKFRSGKKKKNKPVFTLRSIFHATRGCCIFVFKKEKKGKYLNQTKKTFSRNLSRSVRRRSYVYPTRRQKRFFVNEKARQTKICLIVQRNVSCVCIARIRAKFNTKLNTLRPTCQWTRQTCRHVQLSLQAQVQECRTQVQVAYLPRPLFGTCSFPYLHINYLGRGTHSGTALLIVSL